MGDSMGGPTGSTGDVELTRSAVAGLSAQEVEALLYAWQLKAVRVYEVQVQRFGRAEPACEGEPKPALTSEIRVSPVRGGLTGRLSLTFAFPTAESPEYRLQCTLEGLFGPKDASVPPLSAEQLDVRLVSTILTLLWPYAREYMHDLMRRMEVPISPLPTIDKLAVSNMVTARAQGAKAAEEQ